MTLPEYHPISRVQNPIKVEPVIESVIIGFGHRARSGKDSAVQTIAENKPEAKRYAFADILKQEVTQAALAAGGMEKLFGPDYYFYRRDGEFVTLPEWVKFEPDAEVDLLNPLGKQRTLLQWWGTDFRRIIEPNYWVDRLKEKLAKEKPKVALITDMRFPNEKDFVDKNGFSVRVDRPGIPIMDHPSETALANVPDYEWSAIIKNDKSLEDFQSKVLRIYDLLMDENF